MATVDGGVGPQPKVYGILDMSIYVNFTNDYATPYLAEVRPEHKGSCFELDIWDLGDVNGTAWIKFFDGNGAQLSCTYAASLGGTPPPYPGGFGHCGSQIYISDQRFNAEWIHVRIPIPDRLRLRSRSPQQRVLVEGADLLASRSAHDRTTWTARISGDPVRLVP